VALVGLPGKPLRRHAGALRTPRRLGDLEEVPADRLLHALGLVVGLDPDVGAVPEVVQLLALPVLQIREAHSAHPVQRLTAALDELGRRHGSRRLVGDELRQPERPPRRSLRADHNLAPVGGRVGVHLMGERRFDEVLDAHAERHPAVGSPVSQGETDPVDRPALLVQHALLRARSLPGVPRSVLGHGVARVGVLGIGDLRRQHHRRRVFRQHDLVVDRRDVTMLQ
jgi:hypothetical protein